MNQCQDNSRIDFELPESVRKKLVDRKLEDLARDNAGLLVYRGRPQTNKNLMSQFLFVSARDEIHSTNLMGVVAVDTGDGEEPFILSVGSRFDVQPDRSPNPAQPFLTFLLSQAFDGALLDWRLTVGTEQDLWELLLVFLYAHHLVKACKRGMVKQYVTQRVNAFVLKGTLDVPQHIKRNVPFLGEVAQTRRTHTRDNPLLWLVRAAGEHIGRGKGGKFFGLLQPKSALREGLEAVTTSTPSFDHRRLYHRAAECLRPLRHPYFHDFELLRRISLLILRRRGVNLYRRGRGEVFGVLFDGAWLWEEFLFKVLQSEGFQHDCEPPIYRNPPQRKLMPDFVHRSCSCVLDPKYKFWEGRKIEDIHQVLAYMYLLGARAGGVIYPERVEETNRPFASIEQREIALRKGQAVWLNIRFPVPQGLTNARALREIADKWNKELSARMRSLLLEI